MVRTLSWIVAILVLYESIAGWLWHRIGYYSHWHLLLSIPEFLVRNILFPIVFTLLVKRIKPDSPTKGWLVRAFLICLVPLLISTSAGSTIARITSGYASSHSSLGELIVSSLSWNVTLIAITAAFLWNHMLGKFIVENLGYAVAGFLAGQIASLLAVGYLAKAAVPLAMAVTVVIALEVLMLVYLYVTSRRGNGGLRVIVIASFGISPLLYLLPLGLLVLGRVALGM